jgi:predicted RNA-binding protein with PIN domain
MIILVDGYNVLKQVSSVRQISETERKAFIAQLSKYGRIKDHEIIVVFDGGPSDWVYKERISGVLVVYSGPYQSADDYIKDYLAKRRTDDMLLVSNDRELIQRASQLSIESVNALYFYSLVKRTGQEAFQKKNASSGGLVKLTQEDNPELDELMGQASKKITAKREDVVPSELSSRKSVAHKPSKENRKIAKKLKKL